MRLLILVLQLELSRKLRTKTLTERAKQPGIVQIVRGPSFSYAKGFSTVIVLILIYYQFLIITKFMNHATCVQVYFKKISEVML